MRHLLLLSTLLPLVLPCPQAVSTLCRCEDLHNGVALNCSDSDGATVVETLKANQALLGLIQNLLMHRTNVRAVPASFFAGLYIKRLDLSHNRMVKLDSNAFSGMSPVLQDASASINGLTFIVALQELILTHNNLTEIPSEALAEVKTLLKLDLSNNTIGDLTAEQAIPALPKLYDLNLAFNNICHVHKNALAGVRDNVQTINFGHNCLTAVPAPAIRGFKQLQALHMHHNDIGALDALSFMNLPVMNLLNLAANKITDIKQQAFLNVPSLRYLYLTDNQIGSLASYQFSVFEQLEMLDLTRNKITVIPKMAFAGLGQLRQLYLGENHINSIETDGFANSTVVILILASNNITTLDEGSLNGLPNLQQISLKNNHISSIHQNAFYNTPSTAMVDLSGNDITELPPSLFLTQLNLLLIDLSRNKIMKTPYSSFNRRVGTVLLQENPLVCTEKVHMLQDGVGVYIPNSDDIVCGGHPKPSTTTTTTEKALVVEEEQEQEMPIARTSDISTERRVDPIYSRLGIQGLPTQRIKMPEPPVEMPQSPPVSTTAFLQEEQEPIKPVNSADNRPYNPLNVRPANIVSRPRNHFGSELAPVGGRLPSRENPFARTAVHVPASQITTTTRAPVVVEEEEEEEEPGVIEPEEPQMPQEEIKQVEQQIQDEALNKMIDVMSVPPTSTGEPRVRTTTDIRDNPNIIHPFPVPFLKRGPNLSHSSIIRPSTAASPNPAQPQTPAYPRIEPIEPIHDLAEPNGPGAFPIPALEEATMPVHTLPPSIVLAPARPAPEIRDNRIENERYTEFALRTQQPDEIASDAKASARTSSFLTPGLLIGVCLALVFLASIVVFIGLCVAKHKNMRRLGSSSESDSTTARTNAYVAAQQAQMKMMSMSISRPEEGSQPWVYSPSTYSTAYY
uniref:Leucine-rich repeat-containing protein let-4 n=1 Tax=Pristionchus pacificus TaxID=54126 RepID=A0A8R1ZCB8_PRIPA